MADIAMTAALAKALGGGGGGGGVEDVLLDGQSIVNEQGKANIPLASAQEFGVIKVNATNGLTFDNDALKIAQSSATVIRLGASSSFISTPAEQHRTVFFGLAKAAGDTTQAQQSNTVGTYTEAAKSAISQMLSAPETVSGSTPSIVAKPGVQYICGEVSTIDITPPATGCVDIIFVSGSTPTVLSLPTGQDKISWSDGWNETCEANTTYELNILNGKLGVKGQWT